VSLIGRAAFHAAAPSASPPPNPLRARTIGALAGFSFHTAGVFAMADSSPLVDDLLVSADEIARYLRLPDHRRARRLVEKGMPIFYIGGRMCARKSKIDQWLADLESRGPERPKKRR
jgi:hypothetical protein